MGVMIEREEWALTPLSYPLLSAASLAAVLLLPCFSPSQTTSAAAILILLSVRRGHHPLPPPPPRLPLPLLPRIGGGGDPVRLRGG